MDEKNLELVINLRHRLHQHPELSGCEKKTKKELMSFLSANTNLEIIDKGKWFYAVHRVDGNKSAIAFRADMDAIAMDETIKLPYASMTPNVSHKCGHDGHVASLCGLALEIEKIRCDKNVFFLFQHAEETGEGARACACFIEENQIKEIYAYHNMSGLDQEKIYVIDGTAHYASKGLIIYLSGIEAHASQPEKGINPAYTISGIINKIPEILADEIFKGPVYCTIIEVRVGGKSFGISPGEGELSLTIRAQKENDLVVLEEKLTSLIKLEVEKTGIVSMNITSVDVFPETNNHMGCNDKIRKTCKVKGIDYGELTEGFRCSEDFGHYLKLTKGAIFYIGNGLKYPEIHTSEYDFPDNIIIKAVELFKGLIEEN